MAFVKVGVFNGGNDVEYVDPEKVTGYNVYKVAEDCHMVRLYVGGATHTLANEEKEHQGWNSQQAALDAVEKFFADAAENKRELNTVAPHRIPNKGDVFRILDRYWHVTHVDVPDSLGLYPVYIETFTTEDERKPGGLKGSKSVSRMSPWFDVHAHYVGQVSEFRKAAQQLLGNYYQGDGSLAYVLDGFTGHEGMTVHYALSGADKTYCCLRKFPLDKGQVVTDNEHGVTCPQFDRSNTYEPEPPKGVFDVVHYALPEDNGPRCCNATYPLPETEIWMADKRYVTCPGFRENVWCGSASNHDPHTHTIKHPDGKGGEMDKDVRCGGYPVVLTDETDA